MVHPMNVHIHTINKQSPNLDLQYDCMQEKKQRFFNDLGRQLIQTLKVQKLSDEAIQARVSQLMNSRYCDHYVRDNTEPLARQIGLTINDRSVCANTPQPPHLLLMQELSNRDCGPLCEAISPFDYQLVQFEPHVSKKVRHESLEHGTAIFLHDPDGQLELLHKTSLLVTAEDVDTLPELTGQNRALKGKALGNKAAVCAFRFKDSQCAFAVCSEHLSGFNRLQERGSALDEARIPGAIQHESHLQKLEQLVDRLGQEHAVTFAAIAAGGDYNEDERFATRLVDEVQVTDELYRLHISDRHGFKLPRDPSDQEAVRVVSEQGEDYQIDFITVKALADCQLSMNYNAYREQIRDGIDSYPSDHILISTTLTIPQ